MMLPGVELARKRRIHSRGGGGGGGGGAQGAVTTQRGCFSWSPSPPTDLLLLHPPAAMDEAALLARRRLEKKLHGFGRGMSAGLNFSERNLGGEPEGRAQRRGTAAGGGANASAARIEEKPPPSAAREGARARPAWLERMNSAGEDCAVCLDGLRAADGRRVVNLPCAHRYHSDCVLPWLAAHPSCPSCRTPVAAA